MFADSPNPLGGVEIPYIGDQLTRVRLQGAKKARGGDDLQPGAQFHSINPIIVAMWHMKQDFLEVRY